VRVAEIFRSLQGESTYSGLPCTFIRLSGCNLACRWCDTPYALNQGIEMTRPEILAEVHKHPLDLIEITGGEPLLQIDTPRLAEELLSLGATVLVETNGSLDIDRLPSGCVRIMDIKTPSSGGSEAMDWDNIERLQAGDQVKFVIADELDWQWSLNIINKYSLLQRCPVLASSVFNQLAPSRLAEWILESRSPVRLQMQLHKIVWSPEVQGV